MNTRIIKIGHIEFNVNIKDGHVSTISTDFVKNFTDDNVNAIKAIVESK